jgi:dTDP-glucose 4,6-dehydratase
LDAVSYGAVRQNLTDIDSRPGYRFVKVDVADKGVVAGLVRDSELVVHFAAETHVDRSISNPEAFLHSNVLGTFSLLEAARKGKVRKFVHISTDEVYGSALGKTSFSEVDRLLASSPYAASKAAADMFVEAYHKTYGINTVTLRCTNNFGPRQFPEKFIPKTIISALQGRTVPIYGNGMQIRDWIYVLDFCKAIKSAIERGSSGAVYNVSAGNELPNLEIAKLILSALSKPPSLIQLVKDRPGHDFRYSLDSSKIRNELSWKPDHTFQEALSKTLDWYVKNEWWWKPLISDKILSAIPWKEKW